RLPLPALARRPPRHRALRPRADRSRGLVPRLGGGPGEGDRPGARDLRLLQQPLGGALAGERERDEAPAGAPGDRASRSLAAGRAVRRMSELETGTPSTSRPAAAAGAPGPRPAAVAFIFVTVLIDVLAIGLIIPVLPRLVEQFMGGDTARAASVFGAFGTAWALMQFLCSPILGSLSDRFGRRSVILLSCLGLGLDYVFMALAPSLGWLFVGRIISGITAASFSTALAYISDVTPPEKRAASFGLMGAAFGMGFVLGPAVGGLL